MSEQLLGNRYELLGRIGSGGSAQVFGALDRVLRREVAVKVLHESVAGDPNFVRRFEHEAQAAASLNHPNIVSIFDTGDVDGTPYIVMEQVRGPNLKEILREGPLPEDEALDVAAQVAGALEAAHESGIIHRDIKPHNILQGPGHRVKVVDFGIARAIGLTQLTQTHAVHGTAHYISPEQARGDRVDERTDVYSLGVVLYEMLTGREPFRGDNLVEVALRHVHDAPIPPRVLRPDLSPATEAIVLKAMAKDPAERFQTAADMRAALLGARRGSEQEAFDERTVSAPIAALAVPAATPSPAPRPRSAVAAQRRHGGAWLWVVPLVLALAVGAGAMAAFGGTPGTHHGTVASGPGATATVRPSTANHPRLHATTRPAKKAVSAPPAAAPVRRATAVSSPVQAQGGSAPAPTATPAAPTATPLPPSVATAVVSSSLASQTSGGPLDTVYAFYADISAGNLDGAASQWTPAMRRRCDPASCIYGRFSNTSQIRAQAHVVSENDGAGTATVRVDLLEYTRGSTEPRSLSGSWYLIRTSQGWRLDNEAF